MRFCLVAMIFCLSASSGACQIREQIDEENVQLAEEWASEIAGLPTKLPERWAAKQVRLSVNTAQLIQMKLYEGSVQEIIARDGDKATYTKFSTGSKAFVLDQTTDGLGMQVETFKIGNRKLSRIQAEQWQQVEKIPNIGYPSTMPYNWCLGLLNSARSGSMEEDSFLAGAFWGHNGKCLAAWRNREADLVSFWGIMSAPSSRIPPIALRVVFDHETHLIAQYELVFFKQGITAENLMSKDYELLEQGQVTWKPITVSKELSKSESTQQVYVPIYVRVLSVMNEGEEVECENRIQWLFGDQVPDSAFKDPRTSEFKELTFPAMENESVPN